MNNENSAIEFEYRMEKILQDNYPSDTIVRENSVSGFRPDFSIIDTHNGDILAIFEIKLQNRKKLLNRPCGIIGELRKKLEEDIPVYYITSDGENYKIQELVSEDGAVLFKNTQLPSYDNLLLRKKVSISQQPQKILAEKRKALSGLNTASWICAGVIFIVFLVSKIWGLRLSYNDTILLITSSIFVVFPYVKKISYKNVVIENFNNTKSDDKN